VQKRIICIWSLSRHKSKIR